MFKPSVKITAKPSIQPNICEFITNQTLYTGEDIEHAAHEVTPQSPHVFRVLFTIKGIQKIVLKSNSILVLKDEELSWISVGNQVGLILRDLIQSNLPLLESTTDEQHENSSLTIEEIQKQLDATVNPQIASHEGYIRVVELKGNVVYVSMQGGCQGCSQSAATLTHGVNKIIKNKFPQIKEIIDATAHEKGVNPYYA